MHKLSPGQSKKARGLLKWNIRDLSHRSNVPPNRIESFEKGIIHLYARENNSIVEILRKEGVMFQEFGEVALNAEVAHRLETAGKGKSGILHEIKTYGITEKEFENLQSGQAPDKPADDHDYRYYTD